MQSMKNAAKEFISRDKKHDTEVREAFNPAVTKEVIIPKETEETTIAVDRELHQRHYQTRVQPIEDKEVLPEEHRHQVMPVETRVTKDVDEDLVRRRLEEEKLKFKSTREVLPVEHTNIAGATITGEHAHHHVYEQVQPVIEREVIQPAVIHTTVPIHERIEHAPTFHPVTVQPKMTLEEYKRAGGVLEGRNETIDMFEGEPEVRENGGAHQTHPDAYGHGKHHHHHHSGHSSPVPGVTNRSVPAH
ncbi:uncharacterized protein H6S33_012145 [Morchella sextelata]|uniref:uncharacterized protein n=1 Tax=Morchella sextelata TaxID=1174677 RepID=UPI001D037495|nr:uncharacterized protein H6S33_012145 [Morchella sextelata]KAH0610618.1 hypothetical protein H6S33_012145 [Morchella sextelata]